MKTIHRLLTLLVIVFSATESPSQPTTPPSPATSPTAAGFTNAASFGFSPDATGLANTQALQRALDQTGTIVVSQPGTYKIAGTVFIGSHTSVIFGHNVFLKKSDEQGPFSHVLLNKGALTKTYDEHISVEGLSIIVNGMDVRKFLVYGLHGQLAFFYVKDLRIERFRCLDIGKAQYGIHVCTFEDLLIDDVIDEGRQRRRAPRPRQTLHDPPRHVSNLRRRRRAQRPRLRCRQPRARLDRRRRRGKLPRSRRRQEAHRLLLPHPRRRLARLAAGMEVQKSDTVVSNGRLYRVFAKPDETKYKSVTQPSHASGAQELDGITWVVVQNDVTYTAGVRNVVFRDIFLGKPRIGFSVHFDNDKFSRSYYPGAKIPKQEQLTFDNIRVLHDQRTEFLSIGTPVDVLTISNSSFRNNRINFRGNKAMPDYLRTKINLYGCVFNHPGAMELITNSVPNKEIVLKTSSNLELHDDFSATITPGSGKITVDSDLTGLRK
jgi:hypothetical protein